MCFLADIWLTRAQALLISACCWCMAVDAAECSIIAVNKDQTEQVWPYLSNISVSGVFEEAVTLRAGQYEGAPFVPDSHVRPQLRLWPELLLSADLDGKAGDEKIGLLSETSGGSGERVYLGVANKEGDSFRALPAELIGDRVEVRSMMVQDRNIVMQIIEAGPNQPMCCGTQSTQLIWRLEDGHLILRERLIQGELSLELISGINWVLLDRPGDRLNAVHPSCISLRIQGNRIDLEVDGHSLNGTITETSPGQIVISDVMPELQSNETPYARLIADLITAERYIFRAGRLLLSGNGTDRSVNFEFAAYDE